MRTVVHDPNEPVVIRGYAFEYEADLARAVLEAHGMPALLVRDGYEGLGAGPVRLAVRREDAEEALRALRVPASVERDGGDPGQRSPSISLAASHARLAHLSHGGS